MPSASNPIGIKSVNFTLTQSFRKKKKLNAITPLFDREAKFVSNDGRDPSWDFSISGLGDIPAPLVAGSDDVDISGITGGKTLIKEAEKGDKNDNWNDWSCSGENWPSAA